MNSLSDKISMLDIVLNVLSVIVYQIIMQPFTQNSLRSPLLRKRPGIHGLAGRTGIQSKNMYLNLQALVYYIHCIENSVCCHCPMI